MSPVRLFCATYDAAIAQGIPAGEATEAAAEQVWRAALERAAGLCVYSVDREAIRRELEGK